MKTDQIRNTDMRELKLLEVRVNDLASAKFYLRQLDDYCGFGLSPTEMRFQGWVLCPNAIGRRAVPARLSQLGSIFRIKLAGSLLTINKQGETSSIDTGRRYRSE